MTTYEAEQRIVVALDHDTPEEAFRLVEALGGRPYAYKVHHLWDLLGGPILVRSLRRHGVSRIMADLKLHGIPSEVARRAKVARDAGADLLTVHACAGVETISQAVENGPPQVLAVTVLTSHYPTSQALRFGWWAKQARVFGLVSSAHEVPAFRKHFGSDSLHFFSPAIRPKGSSADDQRQVATPTTAIRSGVEKLIIGRSIIAAVDPIAAFEAIAQEITLAQGGV